MDKAYYTPDELSALLPVGRSKIYEMLKAGEIPCKRLGKKYIVSRARFQEWLETCGEVKPAA